MNNKVWAVVAAIVIIVAGAGVYVYTNSGDSGEEGKGGFYSWNPNVVEVNDKYSNLTPAFMSIVEEVYTSVYGEIPSYEGISLEDIPEKYLYPYDSYVQSNVDGTLTVKTFDNTSTGTSAAYAEKIISFIPTQIIAYTDTYIDTIYMILCDYYGEEDHVGNSIQADQKLWELIPAMTSTVRDNLENNFGLVVPESVTIIGTSQEDLVDYCSSISSDENVLVLMSEYNIRSTNKSSWWDTNQSIEANSGGNIQFLYLLSNSPSMVLSSIEMIGKVIGFDNTRSMMTSILAEIYVMQKSIDDLCSDGNYLTFYAETASANSVGSDTLMGGIMDSILKMDNIFDGSLMGSKMSDEDIILAEPQVLIFYDSDSRTLDECMRVD